MNNTYLQEIDALLTALTTRVDKIDPDAAFSKRCKIDLKGTTNEIVTNIREKLSGYVDTVKSELSQKNQPTPTLAQIASKGLRSPGATTENSILVYPKTDLNNSQTRSLLGSKVNFKELQIGVQGVKNLRNGGVLLHTSGKPATEKLRKHLESASETFDVRNLRKRDPHIIIYGVEKDVEQELLFENICEQNDITITQPEEKLFKVKRSLRSDNNFTHHLVVQVAPSIYKTLTNRRRVFIGMSSCQVKKIVWATKCFKCQAYGHIQRFCNRDGPTCGTCAGGHDTSLCESVEIKKCANCDRFNKRQPITSKPLRPIGHTSFDKVCPSYQESLKILEARTNYGDQE